MSILGAAAAGDTTGKTRGHTVMALGVRLGGKGFIVRAMGSQEKSSNGCRGVETW